ncbi:MAG: DUF881 domain-containing protein [Eubacteriales bacterium]|nr:DUF881 domain-containing protein [Eubacteriales bacterium]
MKDKIYKTFILIMFLIPGLIIGACLGSVTGRYGGAEMPGVVNPETERHNELAELILAEKEKNTELKLLLKDLERTKADIIEGTGTGEELRKELYNVKLAAGFTEAEGPGITVKLDDADYRKGISPGFLVIHDSDVTAVLNELNNAGAQALSVNSERIIAISGIICTGPTIRINRSRYAVPYVIHAIGEPEKLHYLLDRSRIVSLLRKYGITVEINKEKELRMPSYRYGISSLVTGLEVDTN